MEKSKGHIITYYILIILLNCLPFIQLSLKSIIGGLFVLYSYFKFNYRHGLITATVLLFFGAINIILDNNVDYKNPFLGLIALAFTYYFTIYLIHRSIKIFRHKNDDLMLEIRLRKSIEKELKEKLDKMQKDRFLEGEWHQAEEAIKKKEHLESELLKLDKLKAQFFANISHEMRTPLNVILSANQIMEKYAKDKKYSIDDEKIIKNINITRKNCYRLLRLFNNLMDIGEMDAMTFEVNFRNHNIVTIVKDICLSVSEYLENKDIKLSFDTDIEELIVACDEEKIERIILNLLSNAVKFSSEKGYIFVKISATEDFVIIKIIDNGVGIKKEMHEEVFKRFIQADDLFSRSSEGSGIGLSLAKTLVEIQGGSIGLESELGVGSIFTLKFPNRIKKEGRAIYKEMPVEKSMMEKVRIEFSDI
ncbi:MAG: HAMP domain-containing sensor histidine kinase [Peptostreptococcales bacterium]|jgi:signal transduction histidine kinase